MEDLSRNISMLCSVCGNSLFESDESTENEKHKCSDCGKEYTKEELLEANQPLINANLEDIKEEALDLLKKELEKTFKKFR